MTGDRADERVPVLIVGAGYAGLASSLFLAAQGVRSLLVDRHAGVSVQGRARGINQRTMELYRPLGLERQIVDAGAPFEGDVGVARCETLAGEWQWIVEEDERDWPKFTAASSVMADQNTVEPILIEAAQTRGAEHCFHTELRSMQADHGGVAATLVDLSSGAERTATADYLVAADGHRSAVRDAVGISRPTVGPAQHWASIVFDADLDDLVKRRALFWIVSNDERGFAAFVATSTPGRWALSVMYDPQQQSLVDFTRDYCRDLIDAAIGRGSGVTVREIVDIGGWEQATGVADRYRSGRVFLVGDAAHTWPPAAAMGANSAVQDAHNLAWKVAAVLQRTADASLLESYEAERRPVALALAELITRRQNARFARGADPQDIADHVLILGQRYASPSTADTPRRVPFGDDVATVAEPGARAPHLWLELEGRRVSNHDLFGDAFVVLTGPHGAPWTAAAAAVELTARTPLRAYRIGRRADEPDAIDLDGRWPVCSGVGDDGAVLIRPDGYVAWTAESGSPSPRVALKRALAAVLGSRAAPDAGES